MRILTALLFTVALAAIASPGKAADPYPIYAILPTTGPAAFIGKAMSAALAVIEKQVNDAGGVRGRMIKFVIKDDGSNPAQSVQLFNGILADKPPVVLGPSLTASCNATAPLVKDGPVVYCFSPGIHPPAGGYMYVSGPSNIDLFTSLARYARARGLHKIAFIVSTDATGQDSEHAFEQTFGAAQGGLTVVDREHFSLEDISVAAQMARIKASGADAVIAWCSGTPFGMLLRNIRDAGIDIPVIASSATMSHAQMRQYTSILPKELLFPGVPSFSPDQLTDGPLKNAVLQFLDAFKKNGIVPEAFENQVWNPTLIVIDAFKKYGFDASAPQIRDYINGVRGRTGTYGVIDFRGNPQRGVGIGSVIIQRYDPSIESWVAVSGVGGSALK